MEKDKIIEEFLEKLGDVKGDGFTIICQKCKSNNVIFYDGIGCGTEYTGRWGEAGIKCKDCGNAQVICTL